MSYVQRKYAPWEIRAMKAMQKKDYYANKRSYSYKKRYYHKKKK